jgi:prevent-host-death family protein
MRKTSIRDLHIRTSELVREAAEGAVIIIERRGEPVAELRPVSPAAQLSREKKKRIFQSMSGIWKRLPQMDDSNRILEEDRDR